MTAGLSVRGHDARILTTSLAPAPISGASAITTNTALPAAGFTVSATGIHSLVPPGPDQRVSPLEGEADTRTMIDTLVAGAVGGDARARDDLLALIHPLVLKYCRARLGRQESLMGSADDVAQDVCMAVVGALPNYQLKGLSFRAFVYGIAAHKVTDAFRAIGRNRAEPVADLPDGPVTADGPEHRLLAAEMSARLGQLLAHLTPRQREVLVLRLAVGLSAEETAQAVRSTPGAVRVTQHRALGRLRKILLGESGARGLAAAERLRVDHAAADGDPESSGSADDLVDPVPDEPGFQELDIDPDVAAADDSAIDAMAAFFVGTDAGARRRHPRPAQADAVQADLRASAHPYSSPNGAGPGSPGPAPARRGSAAAAWVHAAGTVPRSNLSTITAGVDGSDVGQEEATCRLVRSLRWSPPGRSSSSCFSWPSRCSSWGAPWTRPPWRSVRRTRAARRCSTTRRPRCARSTPSSNASTASPQGRAR